MRILLWLAGALGVFLSILKAPFTIISAVREATSKVSREQVHRDIKQILSMYETMPPLGSTQQKMSIRIMHMNIQGGNKPELKSKLKEAIAKPEFKEAIENDIFKWLTSMDYDDYMLRDNASLVQASADRMISSLNDKVDGSTNTY